MITAFVVPEPAPKGDAPEVADEAEAEVDDEAEAEAEPETETE